MLHFYDGQIRRYITQVIRLCSNFSIDMDGTLKQVPVMYGDLTRQVSNIIRDNSENKLPSAPRMAVYITALEMDRDRLADATYVRKTNIVERAYDDENNEYENYKGKSYTVERIMPTPYLLRVNVDIWTSNTDQKLQILEQILVLFNPSLEIQTTDNYIDWTSLSVVNLENLQFTNRSIPVGVDSEIDIATLTLSAPIYISPPAKVKRMGAITNIITSMFDENKGTIDLGESFPELSAYDDFPTPGSTTGDYGTKTATEVADQMANTNYQRMGVYVSGNVAQIITRGAVGQYSWRGLVENLPGTYKADISRIFLTNKDTNVLITGTIGINTLDETKLIINWDEDSFPDDTVISGPNGDRTSIDYIIDPLTFNPTSVKVAGTRILLLESIGDADNTEGPAAWQNAGGANFVADANDIVEWSGTNWSIVFDSSEVTETSYTTNLTTGVQYRFSNGSWFASVDGEYPIGSWRIDLYG
tara:strand:+ start:63 stop:1484 length:1422 start_codon:yes stop_codon:yes gene_type:complete